MPENARQKLSSRKAPTQRESYRYSQGLEVAARPTSYSGTGSGFKDASGLQALTKALESGQGVLAGYGEYKKQKAVADKEEGTLAYHRGEEPGKDASSKKVEGWMRAKGEGDAFEFEQKVSEYLQESWQQPPDQFKEGVEAITSEYLDESKNQSYVEGFAKKAQRAEQQAFMKYMEANHERTLEDGLDNIAKSVRSDLENLEEKTPQNLRKLLSEAQAKGKEFGLTRDTVTSRYITMLGRQAELEGDPSLLNFTNEPDDESGLRLTSTKHAEEVRTWQERAEVEARRAEDQRSDRMKALRDRAKKQIERDFMSRILQTDPEDRESLIRTKQELLSTWSNPNNNELGVAVDARDMKTYVDMIDDQLDLEGFAEKSDMELVVSLDSWIQSASSPEDFNAGAETINQMKDRLTAEDYKRLRSKLGREREQLEDQEYNERKNYNSQFVSDTMGTVAVKEKSIFGGTSDIALSRLNDERTGAYRRKMYSSIASYKREHNGEMPGESELYNMKKRATEEVKEMFPHESDNKTNNSGGSSQSSLPSPPQQQQQTGSNTTDDPVRQRLKNLSK